MMLWTDHDLTGWGWLAMTLGMIVFWGLLITLAVVLVRGQSRLPEQAASAGPSPELVLAERFARGEIDDEEYQRRLARLKSATQRTSVP